MLAGREFGKGDTKGKAGWDDLKNSLAFTWGFVEMLVWFWVSDADASLYIQLGRVLQNLRWRIRDFQSK